MSAETSSILAVKTASLAPISIESSCFTRVVAAKCWRAEVDQDGAHVVPTLTAFITDPRD
jgi:hypothetical protein